MVPDNTIYHITWVIGEAVGWVSVSWYHVNTHLNTNGVIGKAIVGRAAVGGAVLWTMLEHISIQIGSLGEQRWVELSHGPC